MDKRRPMKVRGMDIGSAAHPLKRYCERRRSTLNKRQWVRRAMIRFAREIAASAAAPKVEL